MASAMPVRCAFFDVDETLIRGKSMSGFLDHYLGVVRDEELRDAAARLMRRAAVAGGRGRAALNRDYFRLFRGRSYDDLLAVGREWFAAQLHRGGLFHAEVRAALARHQADGFRVVLVSGSFGPCLDPIAEHVGADRTVGTRLLAEGDVLTGEIAGPMIGRGKAVAAREVLRSYGASSRESYAYGDHLSDLPLLRTVGYPVVVGAGGPLRWWARVAGWPVL